jgi:hypothetical protein
MGTWRLQTAEYPPLVASEYGNGQAEWLAEEIIAVDGRFDNVWATPWYVLEFQYYNPEIPAQPLMVFLLYGPFLISKP